MAPAETDQLLARLLGDTLQTATMRLVAGALIAAAAVGLLLRLI